MAERDSIGGKTVGQRETVFNNDNTDGEKWTMELVHETRPAWEDEANLT